MIEPSDTSCYDNLFPTAIASYIYVLKGTQCNMTLHYIQPPS